MQGCISRLFMGCFRRPVQSESSHLNLQNISDEENVTVTLILSSQLKVMCLSQV